MYKTLDLKEIKKMHDRAYQANQQTREKASDDLIFANITQWDDNLLSESQLAYRGEFNIIRKARRQIQSEIKSNPVQVNFLPIDLDRTDAADLLNGLYRSDDTLNSSIEAYETACQETIDCGYGAWKLYAEYQSTKTGDEYQVIRRTPIWEANNVVFWDPNSRSLDKSDAHYCSVLYPLSPPAYRMLAKDLLGEDYDETSEFNPTDFASPAESYVFPWIAAKNDLVYIVEFYHKEEIKDAIYTLESPSGLTSKVYKSNFEKVADELEEAGFNIVAEKEIKRNIVCRYIASGKEIMSKSIIAGDNIPIIPMYGEHAFVEGQEHWEGITRLAKDPQRLRNFQLSYLADIVSRSPREKPLFFAEQVQGLEEYLSINGADNNYPYALLNRLAADGSPLPAGLAGMLPAPSLPQALIASIDLSRQAVEDVANPALPQNIADPDLSGKAVIAIQNRIDMQTMIYQERYKHAKRRDGVVYASMAQEIYDVPRKVKIMLPDGQEKVVTVLENIIDKETGEIIPVNDISSTEFDVRTTIGPSYTSKKEQTLERITSMIQVIPETSPLRTALLYKALTLMDGVDFDDIRDYASKQLIIEGFKKPETDEEIAILQQAQQSDQQPTPEMLLAQGEYMKGQAAAMREQINAQRITIDAQDKQTKNEISAFNAQTDRIKSQIDAQKANAEINYKNVRTFGEKVDNTNRIKKVLTPVDRLSGRLSNTSEQTLKSDFSESINQ